MRNESEVACFDGWPLTRRRRKSATISTYSNMCTETDDASVNASSAGKDVGGGSNSSSNVLVHHHLAAAAILPSPTPTDISTFHSVI